MARRLFLLIIASFIGVISNPNLLTAADDFTLNGLSNKGVVETIPLPEEKPAIPTALSVTEYAYSPVTSASAPVPANNIQIAGRTIQIVDVADTTVNAGDHVNRYGANFLYGHNSAAVFGRLAGLGVGSTFSVTYGGVTTNYQVTKTMLFEKNPTTGQLQLNGSGDFMFSVSNARSEGVQYGVALMTCAGTSYGNGDASHRLVLFANAI